MNLAAVGLRIRASLIAVGAGWGTAMAATLPIQVAKICSNAIGGLRPLLWSLGAGTLIWGIWTLGIAAGAWLCGGLPLIAIIREDWLLRHPRRAIAISVAAGWTVVLFKFAIWKLLLPEERLAVRGFILYTLLLVVFTAVAAAVYLRLVARFSTSRERQVQVANSRG